MSFSQKVPSSTGQQEPCPRRRPFLQRLTVTFPMSPSPPQTMEKQREPLLKWDADTAGWPDDYRRSRKAWLEMVVVSQTQHSLGVRRKGFLLGLGGIQKSHRSRLAGASCQRPQWETVGTNNPVIPQTIIFCKIAWRRTSTPSTPKDSKERLASSPHSSACTVSLP